MQHPGLDAHASTSDSHDLEAGLRAQLQADPADHAAALVLAGLLLRDSRVDEAIALLSEHALDRDCGDLLREYFVGEHRNNDARRLLDERGSHASASGLVDQAIAKHLRGDFDSAITYCNLAITTDPNYAPAYNHLGRAQFNARRPEPARAAFVRAVRLAPNYSEAWHNLAHVLRDAQELEEAHRAYGHALRLRPAYLSARLSLGIVQMAMRRADDALESFQALLAIHPGHVDGYFNLAVCEHLLGRLDAARKSYERVVELEPRHARAHLLLGRLFSEALDTRSALEQFRLVLELDPRNAEAWADIAVAHLLTDHLDDAERAIAAGLAIAPADPGLRLEQANLARHRGHLDAALSGLRAIDPQTLHPRLHARYQRAMDVTLAQLGEDRHRV